MKYNTYTKIIGYSVAVVIFFGACYIFNIWGDDILKLLSFAKRNAELTKEVAQSGVNQTVIAEGVISASLDQVNTIGLLSAELLSVNTRVGLLHEEQLALRHLVNGAITFIENFCANNPNVPLPPPPAVEL